MSEDYNPEGAAGNAAAASAQKGRAVVEMHRVLKPGGRLMLVDGYRDAPWGWFIYDVCVDCWHDYLNRYNDARRPKSTAAKKRTARR